MSEKLNDNGLNDKDLQASAEAAKRLAGEADNTTSERHEASIEHAASKAEAAARLEKTTEQDVKKIENEVEQARPQESEQLKQNLTIHQELQTVPPPNGEQKLQSMRTYLVQVRHSLSGPSKQFSEFVHNPGINALSEAAGKTVVRPSGVLAGGLLTLIGSGWYYYATKNTGYSYNFMFALLLFVGGFAGGIVLEMVLHLFVRQRRA